MALVRSSGRLLAILLLALRSRTRLRAGLAAEAVRIIVPYPAGGTSDILARTVR